jgi:predicted nuclease of restriction endonuclease-like (RecB) superfamily
MPKEKKTKSLPSVAKKNLTDSKSYSQVFELLKSDIRQAQLRAALSVTKELTLLYWRTGKMISEKVNKEGWGAKTLEKLARDIKEEFPSLSGFSMRNLKYMRQFAESFPEDNWAAAAAQIPWGHNMIILDKIEKQDQRLWYIQQTIENGWSRSMLEMWIESDLYKRQGKAITNFKNTLVSHQSDLAEQTIKDPYNFSFLALDKKYRERELEQGLMDHLQKFLIELGQGFAFVGRQYPIKAGQKDLNIDLLFYHLKLRCYIIVELKAREFDSRDAGQMSAYLSAVDDLLRHESDNPSIGMILCKTKDNVFVEYVLRNFNRPIGVTKFEVNLVEKLPKELKSSLPTVKEIEAELEQDIQNTESPDKKKKGRKKSEEK